MTDWDSDAVSYSIDSPIRSGSAGTTSTMKPNGGEVAENKRARRAPYQEYLTKKGAGVSRIQLFGGILLKY